MLVGLGVWLTTLIVYSLTKAPTLSFWDCGEFIAAGYILGIPHPPGTPLYILIGRIFSILPLSPDIAVRVNYLSVISSSFTALFGYLAAARILRGWMGENRSILTRVLVYAGSAAGAFFLAFGVTNWNNSVEAEVYGLAMAFMALIFYLTVVYVQSTGTRQAERVMLLVVYLGFLGIAVHMTVFVALLVASLLFIFKGDVDRKTLFSMAVFIAFELYLVFVLSSQPREIPYYIPVAIVLVLYLFYIFSFERIPAGRIPIAAGLLVSILPLLGRGLAAIAGGDSAQLSNQTVATFNGVGLLALGVLVLLSVFSLVRRLLDKSRSKRIPLDRASSLFIVAAGVMVGLLYLPKGYMVFLIVSGLVATVFLVSFRQLINWPVLIAVGGVSLVVLGVKEFFAGMIVAAVLILILGLVPRTPGWKSALMIILCAGAGYSVHVFIPVRSAQQPAINENNPSSSLAATISFLERKQYGSEAMVPRMFKRRAEWENQFGNFQRMGFWHFFHQQYGLTGPRFVILFLLGVFGIWEVIRRRADHGLPFLLLILFCSVGLILYMNFADGTRQDPLTGR
ncbi:MAG: DUF2723 domain-containing protein, partial [Candidatus Zixiibacteriota bacterium]